MRNYVLITPAHNEAAVIKQTIECILEQTHRPLRWVIVDDRSSDDTAIIIESYAKAHGFIHLVKVDHAQSEARHFGQKVHAFNRGLKAMEGLHYEFIGNLDADIVLPSSYYASVIQEFETDRHLGIAGGLLFTESESGVVCDDTSLDSVGGAIQLFRKDCFEQLGGYLPLERGGIDTVAEITARMYGWKVRKFISQKAYEQRPTGSVGQTRIVARFREGLRCQAVGYSTIFYMARCAYKCASNRPFLIGSTAAIVGFLWGKLRGYSVRPPAEMVEYLRAEQHAKLRRLLTTGDTSFLVPENGTGQEKIFSRRRRTVGGVKV